MEGNYAPFAFHRDERASWPVGLEFYFDMVAKLLRPSPSVRLTAQEALEYLSA